MTILVTRPSPAGEELVNRLRILGQQAYHFPLIEFAPGRELTQLPGQLASLCAGDMVFVLSQQVVRYAQPFLKRGSTPGAENLLWFAIGRTTALALHTVNHLPVNYPFDQETTETLLQLPELQNITGKQALILRGNGGRELLAQNLLARGAKVNFCECYQRCNKIYDGTAEAFRWQRQGVTTLVATSGEMLQQLYALIPEWYRNNWLLDCRLLVVSQRLADLAQHMGWKNILIADNADNDTLLRTLQQT